MHKSRRWWIVAAWAGAGVLPCMAGLTGAVNTGSVDPLDVYQVSLADLNNGELVNIDRAHTFAGLPAAMQGADYVLTANDDRSAAALTVRVTFDVPVRFYLSIDNRVGDGNGANPPTLSASLMGWVISQGWQSTGWTWTKTGETGNPFTVYTLASAGGTHVFYEQNDGDVRNMYSIAAVPDTAAGPYRYALIDIGPAGQRVEPGGTDLPSAPANNADAATYGPTSLTRLIGRPLTLTVNYSVDWRDRGDSANGGQSLVQVGEDFVKHNDSTIRLTLDDLPRGRYAVTSYHIDPSGFQSPRIQVYVTDAVGSDRMQPTFGNSGFAVGGADNLTSLLVSDTAAAFEFFANGVDPVRLRFHGTPGATGGVDDDETPLNGLELRIDPDARAPIVEPFALIDIGPNSQRVETGALGLTGAPIHLVNNVNYGPVTMVSTSGRSFTFAIDNVGPSGSASGGIDWRDRGDSTSVETLARLGEDFVKNNAGMIRIRLGGLPEGTYRIESFHNDTDTEQCEAVRLRVTDADGVNVLQTLPGDAKYARKAINNLTTVSLKGTGSTCFARADGVNDVILYFDGTAATDKETPLNGLRLETCITHPTQGAVFVIR